MQAPESADEGGTVDLTAAVADADGDDLTTTWQADGGVLAVSPDGLSARWRSATDPPPAR